MDMNCVGLEVYCLMKLNIKPDNGCQRNQSFLQITLKNYQFVYNECNLLKA